MEVCWSRCGICGGSDMRYKGETTSLLTGGHRHTKFRLRPGKTHRSNAIVVSVASSRSVSRGPAAAASSPSSLLWFSAHRGHQSSLGNEKATLINLASARRRESEPESEQSSITALAVGARLKGTVQPLTEHQGQRLLWFI